MFREFRTFISRGNVLDLAVAVIIGTAFGKIVTSLTEDVIMPIIGRLTGSLDFSSYFVRLGPIPESYKGLATNYAELKKAGVPMIGLGEFATQVMNFVIVAFVIFLIVRTVNRAASVLEKEKAAEVAAPVDSTEVILLRQIRDELRGRTGTAEPLPLEGQ